MRPLELTITGLHSYREPVTVDFESLGRFGLFGIFGKIGSGKSTLLDGITLALYGLVDRVATRSRRGLVNLGSDRCEVRLRFAVDSAGGRTEVYEVHRAYREVDGVAQRVASRLTRVSAGREAARLVIAEKEAEVTSAVTEIVGLGAEDFMRAVVLPQGRFAQLLHLKGQERRQMLQRIFRLQAYGETLRKQVRDRLEATRGSLAAVRGELVGLGDASAPVVRAAEQVAIDARAARNESERALAEATQVHGAAERARELWHRATAARSELDQHLVSAAVQAARLARVEVADQLRPLVGPVRRWQAAAEAALAAHQALAVAEAGAAAAAAEEQVARAEVEQVRSARAEREPGLRRLLVRLEQVEQWQAELGSERERSQVAAAESAEAQVAAAEAVSALAEGRVRSAELDAERRRLRREYNKVRVAAEERETVLRASRAADRIHAARRRSEEAHAAEDEARAEVARRELEQAAVEAARDRAAARHAAAEQALAAAEASGGWIAEPERARVVEQAAESERWVALAASHREALVEVGAAAAAAHTARAAAELALASATDERAAADQVLRGAIQALTRAEAALEAARDQAAAAALARALESGVPCAVCGSPHHPAPATEPGELPTGPVEAHRAGREKATRRQEAAIAELGRAAAALEAARATE
ncbi:MAG: SMC family ATPase, partial [Myxococcota bacterium]